MGHHHFTSYERSDIEVFHQRGSSNRKIAVELLRHHPSAERELKRNIVKTLGAAYPVQTATA